MKVIMITAWLMSALSAHAATCSISGRYRCDDDRGGPITGEGHTIEAAKENARDKARALCGGHVDFVRFTETTARC